MPDWRLHIVDLLAQFRRTNRSGANLLSGGIFLLLAVVIAGVLVAVAPVSFDQDIFLVLLYAVALLEILIGFRVGFLRVGQRDDEYFFPVGLRYWRRSLPYVWPALILPLPLALAAGVGLTNDWVTAGLLFGAVVTNYLMFFAVAVAWSAVIRRVSRHLIARLTLALLSALIVLTTLDTGDLIFQATLVFSQQSAYYLLLVILGQVAVAGVAIAIVDLAISTISLTSQKSGSFWPIFRAWPTLGFGQGSGAFFNANRYMLRDSAVQRRLAALVAASVIFAAIVYLVLAQAEVVVGGALPVMILVIFGAGSALVIANAMVAMHSQKISNNSHLPIEKEKTAAGIWTAGAFWQIAVVFVSWGLMASWLPLETAQLGLLLIAGLTQYLLIFGWGAKLLSARHHSVASLVVFLTAVLVGLLPLSLLNVANSEIVLLTQLLWLAAAVILQQITRGESYRISYG